MKKFKDHKTSAKIRKQCEAQGLIIDTTDYDQGSDYILVDGGGSHVQYDVTTGRFFGRTPDGTEFNSDSTKHENEWWFNALLSFFLVEEGGPWLEYRGDHMPVHPGTRVDIRTVSQGEAFGIIAGEWRKGLPDADPIWWTKEGRKHGQGYGIMGRSDRP